MAINRRSATESKKGTKCYSIVYIAIGTLYLQFAIKNAVISFFEFRTAQTFAADMYAALPLPYESSQTFLLNNNPIKEADEDVADHSLLPDAHCVNISRLVSCCCDCVSASSECAHSIKIESGLFLTNHSLELLICIKAVGWITRLQEFISIDGRIRLGYEKNTLSIVPSTMEAIISVVNIVKWKVLLVWLENIFITNYNHLKRCLRSYALFAKNLRKIFGLTIFLLKSILINFIEK
uniref:Uncharacterized protein n=1 Tax=Glossina pallidipes TaxID=7398 RepID=A0A1A9Z529_GLOPL